MAAVSLPAVRMNIVRPNAPAVARVVKNDLCTVSRKSAGFVRHIEFDVSGTALAGSFRVGQAFGVIPPGVDDGGKPYKVRLYSIACPSAGEDGAGAVLSTTVKRTIDEHWDTHQLFLGVASNYLCDRQIGDEVSVTGPNGKRFLLPTDPDEHDYLFIATGTGIAPFRGMVKELLDGGCTRRITLLMGSPYHSDLLYHGDFLSLQDQHENFTYLTAVSRERDEAGRPGMYVHQRLAIEQDRIMPTLESGCTLIYICGVAGMEVGIYQALAGSLTGEALRQYLRCEPEALSSVASWSRASLHHAVKLSDRVFVEVY